MALHNFGIAEGDWIEVDDGTTRIRADKIVSVKLVANAHDVLPLVG